MIDRELVAAISFGYTAKFAGALGTVSDLRSNQMGNTHAERRVSSCRLRLAFS
jgi:hypothetical protein